MPITFRIGICASKQYYAVWEKFFYLIPLFLRPHCCQMPPPRFCIGFGFIPSEITFDHFIFTPRRPPAHNQPIIPLATNERIISPAALERVVTCSTIKKIGGVVSSDAIVEFRASAVNRGISGEDEVFFTRLECVGDRAVNDLGRRDLRVNRAVTERCA